MEDNLSKSFQVFSAVPQETLLGRLLFLLLIDSLGNLEVDSLIVAFADDSNITLPITSEDDALIWKEFTTGNNQII